MIDGFANQGIVGHSASLQPLSRLSSATVDNYGERYAAGTALVQRADFNTLENPFGWTIDKRADRWRAEPAAGLHFVSFTATASIFERVRRAMDGHYPDGKGTGPPPARRRAGVQQHPPHDAPPELPRAAAGAPLLSARRARLSGKRKNQKRGRSEPSGACGRKPSCACSCVRQSGPGRSRTCDLGIKSPLLYQLSYRPARAR